MAEQPRHDDRPYDGYVRCPGCGHWHYIVGLLGSHIQCWCGVAFDALTGREINRG